MYFDFLVCDTTPQAIYRGKYRMCLKDGKVEKLDKGEYDNPYMDEQAVKKCILRYIMQ